MSEFSIIQGDGVPIVRTVLSNDDGAIDLSNYNVYFIYRPKYQTGIAPTTGLADIVSAESGIAEYTWQSSDIINPGVYYCLWRISGAGANNWSTFPNNHYLRYQIIPTL